VKYTSQPLLPQPTTSQSEVTSLQRSYKDTHFWVLIKFHQNWSKQAVKLHLLKFTSS